MKVALARGRHAGLLVPLFAIPSTRSWGVGEIPDLAAFAPWLRAAGCRVLQLLPLNEMIPGELSPYTPLSAMAIDPLYLGLHAVDEFVALGGEAAMAPAVRATVARLRATPRVEYAGVRAVKAEALRAAFARFEEGPRRAGPRGAAFEAFCAAAAWWLEDYALYRALLDRAEGRPWLEWEPALRARDPAALARARHALEREIRFHQYVQWQADQQWRAVRETAGVALVGDLPFTVSAASVDVWARQAEFDLEASVGTPPDAFSAAGQDWGVPPYRWDVVRSSGFAWLRARAARAAAQYDALRIDHVVGFYRTYVRPRGGGPPRFEPATPADQLALGEAVIAALRSAGAFLIAEDLGTVPDVVRASLARLGIPGYRVFRWERDWEAPGRPYRDPTTYPSCSVATTATHDMEPTAVWWDALTSEDRAAVAAIPSLQSRRDVLEGPFTPAVRDALLEALYHSGSNLLVLPVQDVFGWRERINRPATVDPENWTYKVPWPVDRWLAEDEAEACARRLSRWAAQSGRLGTPADPPREDPP